MPITLHALPRGLASIVGFCSGGMLGAGIYKLLILFSTNNETVARKLVLPGIILEFHGG